jgi:transglutaminase-like putative cysteine protease
VKTRVVAFTVLWAGLAIAVASPRPVALVALALPLVALAVGSTLVLDRLGQAALSIAAMTLGVLVPRLLGVDGPEEAAVLGQRALFFAMPNLAVAAALAMIRGPVLGDRVTLLAALVAMTAAGTAPNKAYPVLAALGVVTGLLALRLRDPRRPAAKLLGRRHVAATAFGIAASFGATVLAAWALPRAHDALLARILARFSHHRTGFSDTMYLGDMADMLQSSEVVLRVRGPSPELLRGVVFTSYAGGRWESDHATMEVVETPRVPATFNDPTVEIEHAKKPARYFLPTAARDVAVATGVYERDVFGVAHPSVRFEAKRVWFRNGGGLTPLSPQPTDLRVPARLKHVLLDHLRRWGLESMEPRELVRGLASRLSADYRYSTSFERNGRVDPVIDFLTEHREGHCEYFASAEALLLRASGVPARVVAGYRVEERSPFGYYIVRERNAHSWVEAWIDGRWLTVDPTPVTEPTAARLETPLLAAALDGLATTWERVDDWLARRSPFEMSLMLVALVAIFVGGRAWRGRAARQAALLDVDAPTAGFVALTVALEKRGIERTLSETLSRFASRVEAATELSGDLRVSAAALMRRYEASRYGGHTDAGLDGEMMATAKRAGRTGT